VELSAKARRVLKVIAEEYEKSPETRLSGMLKRVVGAKAGVYLNFPIYEIGELERTGLVRSLGRDRVILTQTGYRYARPLWQRTLNLAKEHPVVSIGTIVGIVGIVVTVVCLLMR
jgi:hypothetical protein